MKYKLLVLFFLSSSLLCVVFGITMKKEERFELSDETLLSFKYYIYEDMLLPWVAGEHYIDESVHYLENPSSIENLTEKSDLVAKIKILNRVVYSNSIKTECVITEILSYEGEILEVGSHIYIFERYMIFFGIEDGDGVIAHNTPLLPMKEEDVYIVFLSQIEGYSKGDYFNLTSLPFGYFPVGRDIRLLCIEKDKLYEKADIDGIWTLKFSYIGNNDIIYIQNEMSEERISEYIDKYCAFFEELNNEGTYSCSITEYE